MTGAQRNLSIHESLGLGGSKIRSALAQRAMFQYFIEAPPAHGVLCIAGTADECRQKRKLLATHPPWQRIQVGIYKQAISNFNRKK